MKLILNGNAHEAESSMGGTYILQERSLVNEKSYWVQKIGKYAIWWSNSSSPYWIVGKVSQVGNSLGFIYDSTKSSKIPLLVRDGWRYLSNGDWHKAVEDEIIFEDNTLEKSEFIYLLYILFTEMMLCTLCNVQLLMVVDEYQLSEP